MANPITKETLEKAEICNNKQYHLTNIIQPFYVLLVLNPKNYQIVYAGNNSDVIFGVQAENIIDKRFLSLLDKHYSESLIELLEEENIKDPTYSQQFYTQIKIAFTKFERGAVFYRNKEYICVEIETHDFKEVNNEYFDQIFLNLTNKLNSYEGKSRNLANIVCKAIYQIIGFDRIWYCEFDEYGNSFVSGEYNNGIFNSLMEHRFPSTDLPPNIINLYVRNKFRIIINTKADPAVLVGKHGNNAEPIDLTYSIARSHAQSHLEYLVNMGVTSSTSFSVVRDGKLIAMFGAHCKAQKNIKYRHLAICQYLVEQYLTKFQLISERELLSELKNKEEEIEECVNKINSYKFDMANYFAEEKDGFITMLNSDSFICKYKDKIYGGENLSESEKEEIVLLVTTQTINQAVFQTNSLQGIDDKFKKIKDKVSGLLAIRIDEIKDNTLFIWLRKEFVHNEKWAGNPSQAVIQDKTGKVGPRKSFESWVRLVEGTCRPWQKPEIKIALIFKERYVRQKAVQTSISEAAATEKNQFLLNISHDLRTPIHSMLGATELLYKTNLTDQQKEYIKIIKSSENFLLSLINDVLELSKIEANTFKLSNEEFSLLAIVDEMISASNMLTKQNNNRISFEYDHSIPDKLIGDSKCLKQILFNIIGNAIKFTKNGSITLRVKIVSVNQSEMIIFFEVEDTGIGIAPDKMASIFEKYKQAEDSTYRKYGGTGLGLAICKDIVELMGGVIGIESKLGIGTNVCFKIPFSIATLKSPNYNKAKLSSGLNIRSKAANEN